MPRLKRAITSRLPSHEVGICLRIREARLALGLSQQEFSRQIGINRERLASYEDARAPLKTPLALELCNQFIVSERWLATGAGYIGKHESEVVPFSQPMARMCMGLIHDRESQKIGRNVIFSSAYKGILNARWMALWDTVGLFPRIGISPADNVGRLRNVLQFITTSWIGIAGEDQKKRLLYGLIRAGYLLADQVAKVQPESKLTPFEVIIDGAEKNALAKWEEEIKGFVADYPEFSGWFKGVLEKKDLTNVAQSDNIATVKAELPALLKRLNEATRERGTKTALAKFMRVDLPAVSRWLSGEKEPGGETTLRLLHWVEQQERQK